MIGLIKRDTRSLDFASPISGGRGLPHSGRDPGYRSMAALSSSLDVGFDFRGLRFRA